jgi:hypothetical protein
VTVYLLEYPKQHVWDFPLNPAAVLISIEEQAKGGRRKEKKKRLKAKGNKDRKLDIFFLSKNL